MQNDSNSTDTEYVSERDSIAAVPFLGHVTYGEAHAFQNGLYAAVRGTAASAESDGYADEDHWWKMGWIVGRVVKTYTDL